MPKYAEQAWVQQEVNDLSDLIAGVRWCVIALAFALLDARAIERSRTLETIDQFIDFVRLRGTDAELVPLEAVRDFLEQAIGAEGATGSIELMNLAALFERIAGRRGPGGAGA